MSVILNVAFVEETSLRVFTIILFFHASNYTVFRPSSNQRHLRINQWHIQSFPKIAQTF